jgi:hypothetical protein
MNGGRESDVPEATRIASDPRLHHYWDGENRLGDVYRSVLALPGPAWDVFMLFDRTARWSEGLPPEPAF